MSLKLHYQKTGRPDGPCLIFLHGLFGSGRNLYSLAKQFSKDYQIYLPDLRNHGQSFHQKTMDYHSMYEDIADFIKTMEIIQPVLIGHSMGGKVGMVNALLQPSLIKALIILDIAPTNYAIDYIPLIDTLLALDIATAQSRQDVDKALRKTYDNTVFRQFLLQNLIRIENKFQWKLNLKSIRQHIEDIKSFPDLSHLQYDKPTLFLRGADSDYVLAEHHPAIKQLFPENKIVSIKDAGHWLQADQPQIVAETIRTFLKSLENP